MIDKQIQTDINFIRNQLKHIENKRNEINKIIEEQQNTLNQIKKLTEILKG